MNTKKMKSIFTLIVFLAFVSACVVFIINSTSNYFSFNVISYFWPFLFLVGIAFAVYIIKNFRTNNLLDNILSIIVLSLCVSSLGFYGFFFYLGKVLGT